MSDWAGGAERAIKGGYQPVPPQERDSGRADLFWIRPDLRDTAAAKSRAIAPSRVIVGELAFRGEKASGGRGAPICRQDFRSFGVSSSPKSPLDSGPYALLPAAGIGLPRVLSTWSSAIWHNHGPRLGRCQGLQGGHRIMTCFVACFSYPGPLTGSSLTGASRKRRVCLPLAPSGRSRPEALRADRRASGQARRARTLPRTSSMTAGESVPTGSARPALQSRLSA